MFDVAIIGAGVVGGFVARELSKYDCKICILEKENDVAMGATRANSAIVHAGFDAKEGSLKAKLNVRGSKMMEGVARELGVKYKKNGSIVVGFTKDDENSLAELLKRGEKNGVEGLYIARGEDVFKLEPTLSKNVTSTLVAPSGAIVCPYELCMAAIGNAMDNGASLKCNFKVEKIEKTAHGYKISSESDSIFARIVINCAGVYSDEVARLVGEDSFTVFPRRGEYLLLDKVAFSTVTHTIFRAPTKMGKGVLVTPTVDGNLLVGPTAENIEDKEDRKTTAEGIAKIKELASGQVANIDYSKVITSFTGLRSVGSTGDFIINIKDGFVNCAGIESPGLSSAPAIGEYVRELIFANGFSFDKKENYNPSRKPMHYFRDLSIDEKNEIIKNHPEYAHVICRCEIVTEGEILEAIRTNPRPTDIDGVKRRTRASMGRCQGGFCTPYIIELLAKECGCEYEEVTKFGGKSYVNLGKTKGEF